MGSSPIYPVYLTLYTPLLYLVYLSCYTGVRGGLGQELAKQLVEKGWQVVGISRTKPDINITHIATEGTYFAGLQYVEGATF